MKKPYGTDGQKHLNERAYENVSAKESADEAIGVHGENGSAKESVSKALGTHRTHGENGATAGTGIGTIDVRAVKIVALVLAAVIVMALAVGLALAIVGESEGIAEGATALKQGSSGTQVRTLQTKLKSWGYYTGSVDGIFGSGTKKAVVYFQQKNGLYADGIVGAKTAAKLGMTLSSTTSSGGTSTSSDLTLLAKLVYAEARGEPYTGQVAVAAVVLNRVRSSSFPNTIAGVVYQSGAFDCVGDGQINLTPNATAKSAAQDAMNGWDPSGGCLFYYNPATATSKWMLSRPTKLAIGNHNFC